MEKKFAFGAIKKNYKKFNKKCVLALFFKKSIVYINLIFEKKLYYKAEIALTPLFMSGIYLSFCI